MTVTTCPLCKGTGEHDVPDCFTPLPVAPDYDHLVREVRSRITYLVTLAVYASEQRDAGLVRDAVCQLVGVRAVLSLLPIIEIGDIGTSLQDLARWGAQDGNLEDVRNLPYFEQALYRWYF